MVVSLATYNNSNGQGITSKLIKLNPIKNYENYENSYYLNGSIK